MPKPPLAFTTPERMAANMTLQDYDVCRPWKVLGGADAQNAIDTAAEIEEVPNTNDLLFDRVVRDSNNIVFVFTRLPRTPTQRMIAGYGVGSVHLASILRQACKDDFVKTTPHGCGDIPGRLRDNGHGLNFVVRVDGEYKRVIVTSAGMGDR